MPKVLVPIADGSAVSPPVIRTVHRIGGFLLWKNP